VARIAAASEGMTGADLKRLIEDGKVLFAFDKARGKPLRTTTEYVLAAIGPVLANRERYAAAEARMRAMSNTKQSDDHQYYEPQETEDPA